MRSNPRPYIAFGLALASVFGGALIGCGGDEDDAETEADEGPRVHGLTEAQAAERLAKIGATEITVGEFAHELANKGAFVRSRYASPERRREYLDQMIRFELLAQEATRRGYTDLPEVQRARKQILIRRFLERHFEGEGASEITDEDVRAYYDANRSEFQTPAQVRASHILFRDRASAQRVLRQLQGDPDDLRLYRRLAEEHNTDPATRERFGDLRFFARPGEEQGEQAEVPAPVAEAAFAIERIGGIHPEVVQSEQGFHIVKLTGRRAAMHRSVEDADRTIRNRLFRERREAAIQALVDRLRSESDVEENLDLLSDVRIDLSAGDSPTVTDPRLRPPGTRGAETR